MFQKAERDVRCNVMPLGGEFSEKVGTLAFEEKNKNTYFFFGERIKIPSSLFLFFLGGK